MAHPLLVRSNSTKAKLARGEATLGLFLLSASSIVAEVCSTLPIDWLIIDMEASPVSHEGVLHVLQALSGSRLTPMIRVRALEHHGIEQALDLGTQAILVPKVDDATAARRAAAACRYPPDGRRGVNPVRASGYFSDVPGYLREANEQVLCMVQIESAEAVRNVQEIAAEPGVDVLFIGCGDLAMSLGQPGVVVGERMDQARVAVLAAARAHGKVPGIFAYGVDLAVRYLEEGFLFVALGNDVQALRDGVGLKLAGVAEKREVRS
jgi:2-keto-3-deoxy-L-rhamnonate aldolase RhmA